MKTCKVLLTTAVLAAGLSVGHMVFADSDVPVGDASQNYSVGDNSNAMADQYVANDQQQAQVGANIAASDKDPALLLNKMQAMQDEIQQLRGQLEVQAHDLKMLRQQQQAFYNDLDQRIAQVGGGQNSQPTKTVAKAQAAAAKTIATAAPAATKVAVKKVARANQNSAEKSYEAAYQLITDKQFSQAIPAMQNFLKVHGDSPYAANAHYWLGELFLAQGQIDSAITEFGTVVKTYPDSTKVAASMLKLGFAYYDKGDLNKAKSELNKVQSQFPDTTSARLAQTRLRDMQQSSVTTR